MQETHQTVALAQAGQYQPEEIQQAAEALFQSLDMDAVFGGSLKGKKVVVKPNLLMKRKPEEVTTTHPEVIKAVIRCLQKRGADQITIADSPGGLYNKSQLVSIYRTCGMEQAARETGAALNYDVSWGETPAPDGKYCREFNLIQPIREADWIISVGKLKTHCMTGLSGGVKNLFGCIPGLQKPELHYRFQKREDFCAMLVDLAQTVRPCLTVLDAVESMEGDGPSGGTKRQTGFLIGSQSPFCLDRFLCNLLNFQAEELPTVSESIRRGLCPEQFDGLDVHNPDGLPVCIPDYKKPKSSKVDFTGSVPRFLRKPVSYLGRHLLESKPLINPKSCIGCGKCAESCPAKTIQIEDKKARIDYGSCIKCFCCHEMCPVKAISVKKPGIFRIEQRSKKAI